MTSRSWRRPRPWAMPRSGTAQTPPMATDGAALGSIICTAMITTGSIGSSGARKAQCRDAARRSSGDGCRLGGERQGELWLLGSAGLVPSPCGPNHPRASYARAGRKDDLAIRQPRSGVGTLRPVRFSDIRAGDQLAIWVWLRRGSAVVGLWHRGIATWETSASGKPSLAVDTGGPLIRRPPLWQLQIGDLNFSAPQPSRRCNPEPQG